MRRIAAPQLAQQHQEFRMQLKGIFKQSPSLRECTAESVADVYPDAVRQALIQTGLSRATFPQSRRCSFDQLTDRDFLPPDAPLE